MKINKRSDVGRIQSILLYIINLIIPFCSGCWIATTVWYCLWGFGDFYKIDILRSIILGLALIIPLPLIILVFGLWILNKVYRGKNGI